VPDPSSPVTSSRPGPSIGLIRIDRPERRNALNLQVKQDLVLTLKELTSDPAIRAIVITGGPDVFVAGTDLAEMADMTPESHAELDTNGLFKALRASTAPVIAAVEGYALGGGCELALACDLVVAGRTARFGQPEIRVGIMPGAGGTQWLPRLAGRQRGLFLLLTGEMFGADEAFQMGLVSQIVEPGQATDRAVTLASTLAAMPPLAVRGIREAVAHGLDHGVSSGLARERALFEALFDSEDQTEGMKAFLEKRPAVFTGR